VNNGWWCRQRLMMQPETERGDPEARKSPGENRPRGKKTLKGKKDPRLEEALGRVRILILQSL